MIQDYDYNIEGLCLSCGDTEPLAPWGSEPWCFPCRGYLVLDCGEHIVDSLTAQCDGIHLPVTTCERCDETGDGKGSNHTHTPAELDEMEAAVTELLDETG